MRQNEEPFVSIVTPVYNGAAYLDDCMKSVFAQGHRNWEYVVIDNCSSDETPDIAARYARMDTRVRFHRSEEFRDIIANWNFAVSHISAEARYYKMICADDWLYPDCLAAMIDVAEAAPRVGIVGAYRLFGPSVNLDGIPCVGPPTIGAAPVSIVSGHELCRSTLRGGPYVFGSSSSVLVRGEVVRETERFYDPNTLHADSLACYRVLRDWDFGFVHQVLTATRRHSGSVTDRRAKPLQTKLPAKIYRLQQFGGVFLGAEEARARLEAAVVRYFDFLTHALEEGNDASFWDFHHAELDRLDLSVRWRANHKDRAGPEA